MEDKITLEWKNDNRGGFYIHRDNKPIAELEFELEDGVIDAYHTGVRPEFEGQGIAARLVDELASFAREHSYTIIPSCPYISAKFRRAPEKFNDLWHR